VVSNLGQLSVPKGYQQAEIGIIPHDWEVKNVGSVLSIRHGRDQKQVQRADGAYPILGTGGEMGRTNTFLYDKPSVLIGRKGTINKPAYMESPFWTVDTLFYSEVDKKYVPKFIFYKFCMIDWLAYNEASGVPSLNASTIESVLLSLPSSKKEQAAIAKALSDVDALITSLEKLIAKKRAIKTAAMQQLLTGKKRLPPFDKAHTGYKQTELGEIPADWEIVGLGRLFEPKLNRKRVSSQDDVTFVGMQDVTETAKINNMHKVKYSEVKSGFTYFERNDVLVAKITPCFENGKGGYADVIDTQVGFGSTEFHVLRARDDVDSKYLFYFTNTVRFRSELESEMVGSAGHRRVPFSSVQKFRAAVTLDKEEQKAIANTLSEMDFEIDAVVSRLKKTQQIKQGMMQELLAGKTRLF
jgi:type I restriction enzyme S subunit